MTRHPPPVRADFAVFDTIGTRWADNDIYGHVNNVAFYGFVDTAVNRFLIARAGLDIHGGPVIALVVETGCRFHRPLAFPGEVVVGLTVAALGTSSVTWRAGMFGPDGEDAAADARFVHVLVDRATRRPVPWPDSFREAFAAAGAVAG